MKNLEIQIFFVFFAKTTFINLKPHNYETISIFNSCCDLQLAEYWFCAKWAYVNKSGKVVIKRQFDEAYPFVEDLALVKIGDYYGFINNKGVYKINPQYTYVSADYISNAIYGLPFYSSVMSDR